MIRVLRIQDRHGRGPFRPGMSRRWCDEKFAPGMSPLPTWMDEFGCDLIDRLGLPGEHFGSAVRTMEQLSRWFSDTECYRLEQLSFNIVSLRITRVLAESENQLVFARRTPLACAVTIIPWMETRVGCTP